MDHNGAIGLDMGNHLKWWINQGSTSAKTKHHISQQVLCLDHNNCAKEREKHIENLGVSWPLGLDKMTPF